MQKIYKQLYTKLLVSFDMFFICITLLKVKKSKYNINNTIKFQS